MNRAGLFLLDILYPNRCPCCGEQIRYDAAVCAGCAEQLTELREGFGAWAKRNPEYPWIDGAAAFRYTGAAKEGILSVKRGERNFVTYTTPLLARAVSDMLPPEEIDLVTCVPMARARRRVQGYAHAELFAKALAEMLHSRADSGLLIAPKHGKRQHLLGAEERVQNAKRFQAAGADLRGKTVLLCDDILTTGSTLRECTLLLQKCGAARVYIAAATVRILEG